MAINRRRAPSSEVSSKKKLRGHSKEKIFAELVNGDVITGTQKPDVYDQSKNTYSVKSGKKWQIFLYSYSRVANSTYISVLKDCLDSFTDDTKKYFEDRTRCIEYKENFVDHYGREAAKTLSISSTEEALGFNE